MTEDEARAERKPYQQACTRVWNAAQRNGVNLGYAMGFFTAMDWQEIASGQITAAALDTVMKDIAARDDLRQRLKEEKR